jgi:hypothetical protein
MTWVLSKPARKLSAWLSAKCGIISLRPKKVFTEFDLFAHGLSGDEASACKRDALGAELGIGYGNAKRFLQRLNDYGVTREEFAAALAQIEKGTTWTNQ